MFKQFLNSLKRPNNVTLIEAIQKGYQACFESIELYHGSGKQFSSFLMNKVGTGEGIQKFGYGIYFTESKDIAKFYAEQAIKGSVIYKVSVPSDLFFAEWDESADTYANQILKTAKNWKKSNIDDLMDTFGLSDGYEGQSDTFGSLYGLIAGILGSQKKASGFLLKASIDGIKYQSGTLSNIDDSDYYNYVIFDQNVAKIKETTNFPQKTLKQLPTS